MSRRIDIEITSVNGPTATWRAAGAKQPKGVLDVALLGGEFAIGSIFRAEIEQYMEGVEVLAVAAPKTASPIDPRHERIERVAPEQKGPDVVVTYSSKGRRRDDDERPRRDRPSGERRSADSKPKATRSPGGSSSRSSSGASTRPTGGASSRPSSGAERPARRGNERSRPDRARGEGRTPYGAPPVATVHRNAFLATLSPEQLPVAEQLLRGGMPAVRQAVADQNRNAVAQGRTTVNEEAIDRIALDLLGRSSLAMWKDRATGAIGAGKELRLRDLRAVVTSAKTVSLDDEGRAQLKELQGALTTRVEALRTEWTAKLDKAISDGDVVEALRLSNRTPEPGTRVSSEAAAKIATMASEALTADADVNKWKLIVELASESPLRRLVKPVGVPDDVDAKALAVKNAGAIPEFAKLLGMKVPPPPPPTARPSRTPRPPRRAPATPRSS